jgi:hypothetical protein
MPEPISSPGKKGRRFRKPRIRVKKMKPPGKEEDDAAEGEDPMADLEEIEPLSVERPVKLPSVSPDYSHDATTRVRLPSKRPAPPAMEDVFDSALESNDDKAPPESPRNPPQVELTKPGGGSPDLERAAELMGAAEDGDVVTFETIKPSEGPAPIQLESLEEIQASAKAKRPQGELLLDGGPKGKFEGQDPNLIEGEDLDIPPFLRNKK